MISRIIRPYNAPRELPTLLESLTVAEILKPSPYFFWSVPVFENAPLIDNRTNGFVALDPKWPQGIVRLDRVMATLAERGSRLIVEALDTPSNRQFAQHLSYLIPSTDAFSIRFCQELTSPGCSSYNWLLSGRIRWTQDGVFPEESLTFSRDEAQISEFNALLTQGLEVTQC